SSTMRRAEDHRCAPSGRRTTEGLPSRDRAHPSLASCRDPVIGPGVVAVDVVDVDPIRQGGAGSRPVPLVPTRFDLDGAGAVVTTRLVSCERLLDIRNLDLSEEPGQHYRVLHGTCGPLRHRRGHGAGGITEENHWTATP